MNSFLEDLVPVSKLEIVAYVLCGLALVGLIFFGGWTVNGWRLNALHAQVIAAKDSEISELKKSIMTQNHAVDILDEKSKNAIELRKLAEQYSQQLVNTNHKRQAVADGSKATDCDGYNRNMWESW